jgi:hypothetical protein
MSGPSPAAPNGYGAAIGSAEGASVRIRAASELREAIVGKVGINLREVGPPPLLPILARRPSYEQPGIVNPLFAMRDRLAVSVVCRAWPVVERDGARSDGGE